MVLITRPQLPPKAGYVEDEIDGIRVYRNVETGETYGRETPKPDIVLDIHLALAEIAEAQEAYQIQNELALTELAELIGG